MELRNIFYHNYCKTYTDKLIVILGRKNLQCSVYMNITNTRGNAEASYVEMETGSSSEQWKSTAGAAGMAKCVVICRCRGSIRRVVDVMESAGAGLRVLMESLLHLLDLTRQPVDVVSVLSPLCNHWLVVLHINNIINKVSFQPVSYLAKVHWQSIKLAVNHAYLYLTRATGVKSNTSFCVIFKGWIIPIMRATKIR